MILLPLLLLLAPFVAALTAEEREVEPVGPNSLEA